MNKQDLTYARTAQDIERKYSFGKTFAEMLGLINDNRDRVDTVESSLRNEITEQETSLRRNTQEVVATATETVKSELGGDITAVGNSVSELTSRVEMKLDAEAVNIAIEREISKGVDKVTTKAGYSFGDDGLNITKSGEAMSNKLDHTGMHVKKNNDEILTADKDGVKATDLHARTYLIIGSGNGRSRFEDYGSGRTGCFWLGG